MSNKMYDFLKWFALIFIPALTVFVGIVGRSIGFEQTDVVVTIMAAFGTFIGSCLGVSCANYNGDRDDR